MMQIRCPYISVAHMHKTHNQYITTIRDPAHVVWHHLVLYCIPEFFIFWCRDPVTPDPSTFSPWLPSGSPLRLHPQALFKLFQGTSKTLPDIFSGLLLTGLSPCRVHADRSQPHANASEEVPTRFRQHEITRSPRRTSLIPRKTGFGRFSPSDQAPPHANKFRQDSDRPGRHQNRFRQEKNR